MAQAYKPHSEVLENVQVTGSALLPNTMMSRVYVANVHVFGPWNTTIPRSLTFTKVQNMVSLAFPDTRANGSGSFDQYMYTVPSDFSLPDTSWQPDPAKYAANTVVYPCIVQSNGTSTVGFLNYNYNPLQSSNNQIFFALANVAAFSNTNSGGVYSTTFTYATT